MVQQLPVKCLWSRPVEQQLRVLIVDDHPLVREALARVLPQLGRQVDVLQAGSVGRALAELAAHPDTALVLLDLTLPDAEGTSAVKRIREAQPSASVVVFSAVDNRGTVLSALDSGATGFISKRSSAAILLSALHLVLAGEVYIPPEALSDQTASPRVARPESPGARVPQQTVEDLGLTQRQAEVLKLLVQGKPNKVICRELGVSVGTVKTHTAAIFRALRVSNRTQAVFAVNRLGIEFQVPAPVGVANRAPAWRPEVRRVTGVRPFQLAVPA